MPLVQAWQCPKTGKLFAEKGEYVRYVRKAARASYLVKRREQVIERQREEISEVHTMITLGEIENWIKTNWSKLAQHYNFVNNRTKTSGWRANERCKILAISIAARPGSITLSHSAPLNMPNEDRYADKKQGSGWRSYNRANGWAGEIKITFNTNPNEASSVLRMIGINAGSGGYRGNRYTTPEGKERECYSLGYTVDIFEDDFYAMSVMDRLGK